MAEDFTFTKSQTNPRHLEEEPFEHILTKIHTRTQEGERSGSVVECLTRDRGARFRASPASLRFVLEQEH